MKIPRPQIFHTLHTRRLPLVLLLLLAGFTSPALGQRAGGQNMEERMQAEIEAVMDSLALSEEKDVQVRAILAEDLQERTSLMQDLRGQNRDARAAMREKMTALDAQTDEKLEAVLSAPEMEKYTRVRDELRESQRGRPGGGQGRGLRGTN